MAAHTSNIQKLYHQMVTFDGFRLDLARGCLLRGEEQVKLRPKSFDVLRHLSENSGRLVTKAELMQAVWPDSFVTDDSLVQCLIEIRRALGDDSHRYIKTVPRRGYIFEAEVANHFAAGPELIYTHEAEGVSVIIEEEVEEEARVASDIVLPAPQKARRQLSGINFNKRALVALVVSVLALGGLGAYLLASRSESIDSVAVMPFVNVGGDSEMEYLANGITESVINNLSQLHQLKVISCNSVMRYKGKEIDPRAVGRELGVRAVLVGRLEPRGDKLAFSLELVDSRDNRQLWGEQYTRQLSDALQVQADISRAVSERLRLRLTGEEQRRLAKRHTDNAEAYQLYLRGRYHWDKWTANDAEKSVEYFEQAIKLDPNFALAYTGLADSYFTLNGIGHARPNEVMPKAKEAVARALEIDDTLAEAHASLGLLRHMYDWDWAGAEYEFKRAIELNPNSSIVHELYAKCLGDLGRFDESIAEMRRALELDPYSVGINKDVGETFFYARRYDEAIAQWQKTLELEPNYSTAHAWLTNAYLVKGLYDQAIDEDLKRQSARGNSPERVAELKTLYARSGWKAFWQDELAHWKRRAKEGHYYEPYFFVLLYVRVGDKEQALQWLEKAYESRSSWIPTIKNDSQLDGLRADPRFQELQRRVGFPPQPQ